MASLGRSRLHRCRDTQGRGAFVLLRSSRPAVRHIRHVPPLQTRSSPPGQHPAFGAGGPAGCSRPGRGLGDLPGRGGLTPASVVQQPVRAGCGGTSGVPPLPHNRMGRRGPAGETIPCIPANVAAIRRHIRLANIIRLISQPGSARLSEQSRFRRCPQMARPPGGFDLDLHSVRDRSVDSVAGSIAILCRQQGRDVADRQRRRYARTPPEARKSDKRSLRHPVGYAVRSARRQGRCQSANQRIRHDGRQRLRKDLSVSAPPV